MLMDSLTNTNFEPRVTRMRERMQHLEAQAQSLKEEAEVEGETASDFRDSWKPSLPSQNRATRR